MNRPKRLRYMSDADAIRFVTKQESYIDYIIDCLSSNRCNVTAMHDEGDTYESEMYCDDGIYIGIDDDIENILNYNRYGKT